MKLVTITEQLIDNSNDSMTRKWVGSRTTKYTDILDKVLIFKTDTDINSSFGISLNNYTLSLLTQNGWKQLATGFNIECDIYQFDLTDIKGIEMSFEYWDKISKKYFVEISGGL